jgi:hyperosmotically inducible protein
MRKSGLALLALSALAGSACTEKDGPAERAGERIDDAVSDARDRIEDAGNEAREAVDEIGDALRDE